jgi:hypothetical protein
VIVKHRKKRKFEHGMLLWLAIKDLTEKYQYPKSRIFIFWVNSSSSLLNP